MGAKRQSFWFVKKIRFDFFFFFEGEMGGLPGVGLRAPRPFRDSGKSNRKGDDESTLVLPAQKASRGLVPTRSRTIPGKL